MLRWLAAAAAAALLALAVPTAHAQESASTELEALIEVLEDDAARAALVERLRALSGGDAALEAEAAGTSPLLGSFSRMIERFGDQAARLAEAAGDPGAVADWITAQATDADGRAFWISLAVHVALALAAGGAAAWAIAFSLRRPLSAMEARRHPDWASRAAMALARLVVVAVPVAAFAGVAYLVLGLMTPPAAVRSVALAAVAALAAGFAGTAVLRATFAPLVPNLRPLPLADEAAAYLFVWCRRLWLFAVAATFAAEAALLLEFPEAGSVLLVKTLGVLFAALVAVLILQNHKGVAAWLAGGEDGATGPSGLAHVRARVAEVWHVLALAYVVVTWVVWTLEIPGGFALIAGSTTRTAVVVGAAWIAVRVLHGLIGRMFAVSADIRSRYPFVAERANLFLPVVRRGITVIVQLAAALAILQVWGLDVLSWLGTDAGRAGLRRAVNIGLIVVIAVAVWEAANAAIRIRLERTGDDGSEVVPSQRARTLLPLLRNVLAVVIGLLTGLVVLSELGISIGPLLAGAGVAGLALGFGAQTLVKDFITGLFILMEDSIQVGDVARVGGKIGVVESLTVRTVRLRDLRGTVHTVPFSSVDTIENLTKEYSYAVIDIGVAYREDYDHVVALLTQVGKEMAEDPKMAPNLLEPLDVMGLDQLADSAVVIRVRFKTPPLKQWGVRREFLRRVKQRFDKEGIEIPFPHATLYFGADCDGAAPPLLHREAPPTATKRPGSGERQP